MTAIELLNMPQIGDDDNDLSLELIKCSIFNDTLRQIDGQIIFMFVLFYC